jgi:hypothetical protein
MKKPYFPDMLSPRQSWGTKGERRKAKVKRQKTKVTRQKYKD